MVIGLGANLGEPLAHFRSALVELSDVLESVVLSPVYRTKAIGPEQPDYLNAALRAECALTPSALLTRLLETEAKLGRRRLERWGPRLIDLDLLWIAGLQLDSERLQVPHPRLEERAFALYPLLDVAPEARHPRSGRLYAELRQAVASQRAERLEGVQIESPLRG